MGTPFEEVYSAFLSKIDSDDWESASKLEMELDLKMILMSAISWFKFPRISLKITDPDSNNFDNFISNAEIQVIAHFMVMEWYNRVISAGENLRPMYSERDFSPAKMLDSLSSTASSIREQALSKERNYYRADEGQPFDFSKLSGGW